jgi:23S rRNA (uracil1939-C5)-methyltransferase
LLLHIEKLVYGGDGLARLPGEKQGPGKAVFVPFTLPGETVEAEITEEKHGYARAWTTRIIEASAHRVQLECPYFVRCGGCHYQHADYAHQLEIKKQILRENLRRIAKIEFRGEIQAHASPPWNYRNRSRLQIRTRPEFCAGYFKFSSHEVLGVESCPISSPLINRGIAALWQAGRAGKVPESVREAEFFCNADDSRMLIELQCDSGIRRSAARAWAEELCAAMPEIVGVSVFRGVETRGPERMITVGAGDLTYQIGGAAYRVSAGAFFQTNRFLVNKLVQIVGTERAGEFAVDLYAGVGLFSTALACNFRHTMSVESSQTAIRDLEYNLPPNGKAVQATAEHYLLQPQGKGRAGNGSILPELHIRPDLIVVDPPRAGLGEHVARAVAKLTAPRLTYVSCDPATLARDLVILLGAGYHIEELHLVDLFPQTFHLESVVQLVR